VPGFYFQMVYSQFRASEYMHNKEDGIT